ncbi:hypothetical protein [Parasitella parasitica]|uniref:Uncharacterized protein n=1 Tax=Parasitella parasitica TaxID=35722 RepID=A0A0B7N7M6_9FUNG|nr:hypothetical protein [Parasitella parasitica]
MPALSSVMNVDSDDDFQPPVKSNLPEKDKDLDAPVPATAPSYSTAVSTPADDFDAILSAMSPELQSR